MLQALFFQVWCEGYFTETEFIELLIDAVFFGLRKLSHFRTDKSIMPLFYHAFTELVLLFTLAAWFVNLSLKSKNSLNQIVKWSSRLIGESQLNVETLYTKQLQRICGSILKDSSRPLFQLLPSGCRFKIPKCKTKRQCNSFVPAAVTLKNR